MTKNNYKRLGDYIKKVNVRNTENLELPLMGLSIQKCFIPSIANTIGSNMKRYKIIEREQFAYGPVTSRNGDKITIALFDDYDKALISQAYIPFEIKDKEKLLPKYLMMWFSRPEFDRYARFKSHGSARETFDWEEMCDVKLPIPSIEKQREIVADYQAVENKIKTNEAICEKLEETAQTIYRRWFEEFEFPCLPSDYRPHGQVNQTLPMDEYIAKIGSVCTYKRVGGLPISDGRTWFVYLILCEDDSIYKGMTNDLYRRFYEHYIGEGAEWTKFHKPLKVIHWESFKTKKEAAKREKDLKTGYGRTWIQRQIEKAGGIENLKTGLPAPTTSSPNTSLPAPTTQLRTAGKMVWNEELEKEVPKGWEVKKIKEVSKINAGGDRPKVFSETKNKECFVPIFSNGITQNGLYGFTDKPKIKENAITVSARGTIGFAVMRLEPFVPIVRLITVIPNDGFLFRYLFDCIENFQLNASGSVQKQLTVPHFSMLELLIPNKETLIRYQQITDRLLEQSQIIIKQNHKLHQLQSLLLGRMTANRSNIILKPNK